MLIVARSAKCRSSLTQIGQFTVENVSENEDALEEIGIKLTSQHLLFVQTLFFSRLIWCLLPANAYYSSLFPLQL